MFDVPSDTTVNNKEYVPPKGAIGFAPELIAFILDGKKLTTYRFGDKYDYLNAGDEVQIHDSSTGKTECNAVIIKKSYITFADLPLRISTHESYKDKESQRKVLSGYYAFIGRTIEDDDLFIKFDFKLKK